MQDHRESDVLTLKGDAAAEVLREYVRELQGGKLVELTEKQTEALIKIARGLISVIEAEARA